MNSALAGIQAFFVLMAIYSLFVKKHNAAAIIFVMFAVKADIARHFLQGPAEGGGFVNAAAMAFYGFAAVFIFLASVKAGASASATATAGKKGGFETLVIITAIALTALFSGGCAKRESAVLAPPSLFREIKLNFVPSALAEPEKNRLFIGVERGSSVRVFDPERGVQVESVPCGTRPVSYQFYGHYVYIANEGSGSVTVYDTVSKESKEILTGGGSPSSIRLDPKKNVLYCANMETSNVSVIALDDLSVRKKIPTGKWPSDLFLSKDGRQLFVACKYTNTVEIIDAEKEQPVFTRVNTGTSPSRLIPYNRRQFIILNEWEYTFNNRSTLVFFDTSDYTVKSSFMVEGGIADAVLTKSKRFLAVTCPLKDKVIFVDLKTRRTVHEIKMPDAVPKWVALSKDGKYIYVSCRNEKIAVIALNGLL